MTRTRRTPADHVHEILSRQTSGRTRLSRAWSGIATLAIVFNLALPVAAVPIAAAEALSTSTTAPSASPLPSGPTELILVQFKSTATQSDINTTLNAAGGQVARDLSQIHTRVIRVPSAARAAILAAYARHPSVAHADPTIKLSQASIPNDPGYGQQWALPKIGWDQVYGSVSISGTATIAVLDTGVDASHPDLSGRMAAGYSSLGGATGGDPDKDPNGHGTALAGIAAASVNNATGMAGVAYSGASIAPVQVLSSDGTGTDADVAAGVLWAADHGANVMLMGFSSPDYSATLASALAYAWAKGAVLVAATGNDGSSTATYPANMPNVIGVASSDQNDAVASSSNTDADVAAPGVDVYSARSGGGYSTVSGTSPASAHVAGLAALLMASGKSNSSASDQIRGTTDAVTSGQSFGRIDVARALNATAVALPSPTPALTPTPGATPTYVAGTLAAITIDGNMSDWGSVTTNYSDPKGDAGSGPSDIRKVWIANDATNIYMRWDVQVPKNKNQIVSAGFNIFVDYKQATGQLGPDGVADTIAWVTFDSSGAPTVLVQDALTGVLTPPTGNLVGAAAAQSCLNTSASCRFNSIGSVEAKFPLASLGVTNVTSSTRVGVWSQTRQSEALNSALVDRAPDAAAAYFQIEPASGGVTPVGIGPIVNLSKIASASTVLGNGTLSYTITLRNVGDQDTTLTSVYDTLPDGFAYRTGTTTGLTSSDPSTSGQTLTWAFSPEQPLAQNQSVTLTFGASASNTAGTYYNDASTVAAYSTFPIGTGETAPVTVSQTAAPAVTLNPTALSFTNQLVNTTSAVQTVTLTNSGDALLSVSGIAITGTDAGQFAPVTPGTGDCPTGSTSLAAGASCTISVTFSPTSTGSKTASLDVTDNATGSPQSVFLSGTPLAAATASKLTFGQQPSNTTAGAAINPSVAVRVEDASGTLITDSPASITLAIGTNPASGTLSGTLSVLSVNGLATFSNLSIDKAGTSYTLSATSSGLADATSTTFNVGQASQATFTLTVPTSITFGSTGTATTTGGSGTGAVSFSAGLSTGCAVAPSSGVVSVTDANGSCAVTATRAADSNYTQVSDGPQTVTLNRATLTVSADGSKSKTFGETFTAFTGLVSGAQNSDTMTVSYSSTGAAASAGFGSYDITVATVSAVAPASLDNYTVVKHTAITGLTVNAAHLTVTADNKSKVYGAANPVLTATVTGFVNSETASVVSGAAALSTATTASSGLGDHAITVDGAGTLSAANYDFPSANFVNGTLTVTAAHLTVTADNKSKVYGAANPVLTATITGFATGETASVLGGALTYTFAGVAPTVYTTSTTIPTNVGTYTMTPAGLTSGNYTISYAAGPYTVGRAALTVVAENKWVQYSDPVTFTATYAALVDSDVPSSLGGTLSFATNVTGTSGSNGAILSGPGTYSITPSGLTSGNYSITYQPGTLTVTPEDARATYTGQTFVSTGSSTAPTANVTLRATIQDITGVLLDSSWDNHPGDIRKATVTFVYAATSGTNGVTASSPIACTAMLSLLDLNDSKTATATCLWSSVPAVSGSTTYNVGIVVGGYYTDANFANETTDVTVSQYLPGMLTGGGYTTNQASAGLYAGGQGQRTNFGFNAKMTKTGGYQGSVNVIVRKGLRVYQIKSNTINSIGSNVTTKSAACSATVPCQGTFTGGANIQDVTDPNHPISVQGGLTIQIDMTDQGEPGSADALAITVYDKGNQLYFSNNWSGAKTNQQQLNGGNLVVH
jgi:subtilisin family serine protease